MPHHKFLNFTDRRWFLHAHRFSSLPVFTPPNYQQISPKVRKRNVFEANSHWQVLHISVSITCLCKVQNSAKSLETPTLFLYFASKESSSLFVFLKSWTVVLQHFWESFKVFLWKQHISCFSSPCTWTFFEECFFLSDASGTSGDPSAVTKSRKVPVEGWLSRSHF